MSTRKCYQLPVACRRTKRGGEREGGGSGQRCEWECMRRWTLQLEATRRVAPSLGQCEGELSKRERSSACLTVDVLL